MTDSIYVPTTVEIGGTDDAPTLTVVVDGKRLGPVEIPEKYLREKA